MKKFLVALLVVALVFPTFLTGCKTETTTFTPKAEYTMQVNVGPAYVWGMGAQKWADLIKEKTNGKINVKPYFGSSLLQGKQTNWIQAVADGSIDCAVDSTLNASSTLTSLNLFSLPFFINTLDNVDKIENGESGKKLISDMTNLGITFLAWGENGFRQITNSKRPISTPADMKGLKFRVVGTPLLIDTFHALGADATSMNWGDAVTAFQQGAVDGQENPYQVCLAVKIWDYHKYMTNWDYMIDPLVFVFSTQTWNTFPDDIKKAITDAAVEAAAWEKAMARRGLDGTTSINLLQTQYKDWTPAPDPLDMLAYVKQHMTVTDLTAEQRQAFIDATKSVYDTWVPKIGEDLYNMAKKDMGQ
ncbi:MAG: DctP family TRAP transporter solute-binding subunit [Candidatus Atribacteria bacterium]|nr:DctP family TRAP transporter solute-binding subunit [Candidatus Atribacteria bacterium]